MEFCHTRLMDVRKPTIAALLGRRVDPPPVWLMRQAGRYLPEYLQVRKQVPEFLDLCFDPFKAAQVTLQPIERFNFDAAILFSDILVVPYVLGQKVEFAEGPCLDPVRDAAALAALSVDLTQDRFSPIYETIDRVKEKLSSGVALVGFAGAPWTVATYMVEGGGSRDYVNVKRWALGDPSGFQSLVDLLVDVTADYLKGQIAAGADAVQLFDTWAGVLPKSAFDRFCAAPVLDIARQVKSGHPDTPVVVFLRGSAVNLPELASAPEIDAIGIDHAVDPVWAAKEIQPRAAVQGNLDPVLLLAGGPELERGAREIVDSLSGGAHVFNLGHGILPQTPVEHVKFLVDLIRS